jgi:glycosyltransferase involved in cell wall biosynthesis
MPMALLEALALKKAVIVSDLGGMQEIVEEGKNGFIFKAGDVKDLAAKIKVLDSQDLSEIGRRAGESVKRLDIQKHYQEIIKIYVNLVKKGQLV